MSSHPDRRHQPWRQPMEAEKPSSQWIHPGESSSRTRRLARTEKSLAKCADSRIAAYVTSEREEGDLAPRPLSYHTDRPRRRRRKQEAQMPPIAANVIAAGSGTT